MAQRATAPRKLSPSAALAILKASPGSYFMGGGESDAHWHVDGPTVEMDTDAELYSFGLTRNGRSVTVVFPPDTYPGAYELKRALTAFAECARTFDCNEMAALWAAV